LIADTGRERTLTVIRTMQIDECGTGGAVTHALHKFSQVRAHVSDQDVASVAKVMHVNAGQADGLERRKPDAFQRLRA
jgi:hypothetical protein